MADNEGLRTDGEAIVLSIVPDFCKTPPSMFPVPYQIIGRFSDGERYVETVCMTGMNVMTMDSRLNTVYGDEAGTGGGVISCVNEGWCRPITHSSTVRSGGHHITYHTSFYWMNCNGPDGPGNTIGVVTYVECVSDVYIGPLGTIEGDTNPPVVAETEEEKGFLHQVGGFFGGLWDGAVDTVTGIKDMGVGAWNLTGGWIFNPEAAQQTWDNLTNVAGAVWENPWVVWDAIKAPYVEAWSKGEYGNAIGRGTFEALSMVFGGKGLDKLSKMSNVSKVANAADKLGDVGKTADKLGDIGKTAHKLGDVGKTADKLADAGKTTDKVSDAAKTTDKVVDGVKVAQKELRRPYIRKSVRKEVENRAPRAPDGRFIDPNTNMPIDGKPDLGHKPGNEFWREKAKAEAEGLSQKEFNDRMNDPDLYQLEDPSSNRSHKYEMK